VVNGNVKETVKDEEIEPYLQQPAHQGAYSAAPMSSPGVNDPFMPSYYNQAMPFPYLSQGLTDTGAWSNGSDQATMLSFGNYDYNSIFGGFGYPQFGWAPDYSGSDYWNNGQARTDGRQAYDYYQKDTMIPQDPYAMNGGEFDVRDPSGVNSVDQGLKGMTISDKDGGQGVVTDQGHMDQNGAPMPPQSNGAPSQAKKTTSWAAIASQPARPQPKIQPRSIPRAPMNPNKNMDIGTWDQRNNAGGKQGGSGGNQQGRSWSAPRSRSMNNYSGNTNSNQSGNSSGNAGLSQISTSSSGNSATNHPVLEKLKSANQYNPRDFNLNPRGARFFIIKSYSEDDIHRSIKYSIWCSTDHGNKRLDQAFKEREGKGPIYLFFSVNGSGHFCGMAQMMSHLDYKNDAGVWAQDKWKGKFEVKWIYVKDVPNSQLRHIRLENNENKPVTNSRDTQEVPPEKGKLVLKIIHTYKYATSIFDDFGHYEKRQEEDGPTKPASGGKDREQ
ncbi:hypothetical protein FSP39_019734, partial [Pinctada imbricata]